MRQYHSSTTNPNSNARKATSRRNKNIIKNSFKNNQKNAMREIDKKYKNAFFDALNSGKPLPRLIPNISSKLQKTLNKYSDPSKGNKAKQRAKNKAKKKIREGEDDLWEPIKSIVKLANDAKEAIVNADFKNNDNAPGINGINFGPPIEAKDISNNKFSGAYA